MDPKVRQGNIFTGLPQSRFTNRGRGEQIRSLSQTGLDSYMYRFHIEVM